MSNDVPVTPEVVGQGLRTTVTGSITHLCPHVDEVDVGTVTFTFDGEAPELHSLAATIGAFHTTKITHEALTATLARAYPGAEIVTRWRTAGLEVEVRA